MPTPPNGSNNGSENSGNPPPEKIEIVERAPSESKLQPVTPEKAMEMGMTAAEVEMGKKSGLIADEKPPKDGEEGDQSGDDKSGDQADDQGEEDAPKTEEERQEERRREALHLREIDKIEEDPIQEAELTKDFNANEKALYFMRKKEKTKREKAEALLEQNQLQVKAAQEEIARLRAQIKGGAAPLTDENGDLLEGDESETEEDKNKPLTVADLEKREKEKADEAAKEEAAKTDRAKKLNESFEALETDAKSRYTDFDSVMEYTNDILKNAETLYPEPRQRSRIYRRVREFVVALASADQFKPGADEDTPADLAYELGKLHPKYQPGKTAPKATRDEQGTQALTPDETTRIAQRRGSSASLPGGSSRRIISADEITVEQASKLPLDQYRKLPKHVRERLLKS